MQALLDAPDTAAREHDFPHIGRMSLGQATDMIYTSDVFLHRWDLAPATGQDGPRVHVPDDADIQTRLLAFIGRTP